MATFPAGVLTANGFRRKRVSNVIRSDMESGPAKQALRASRDYIRFPVTYLFTKAQYLAFDTWVTDTIDTVGWFDWTEPIASATLQARIVNGDISEAAPLNPHMANWVVSFELEVLD
jgi:hypothetical protein